MNAGFRARQAARETIGGRKEKPKCIQVDSSKYRMARPVCKGDFEVF